MLNPDWSGLLVMAVNLGENPYCSWFAFGASHHYVIKIMKIKKASLLYLLYKQVVFTVDARHI